MVKSAEKIFVQELIKKLVVIVGRSNSKELELFSKCGFSKFNKDNFLNAIMFDSPYTTTMKKKIR